jgi:hypothetical protein
VLTAAAGALIIADVKSLRPREPREGGLAEVGVRTRLAIRTSNRGSCPMARPITFLLMLLLVSGFAVASPLG